MTIQISLEQPAERTFIIFRQEADFQRESIPGGETNNGECTTLLSCSCSTRYQLLARNRDALSHWEPMQRVTHISRNRIIFWYAPNETGGTAKNPIKTGSLSQRQARQD